MPALLDMLGHSDLTGLVQDVGADLLALVLLAMLHYIWLRFRRARGEQRLQRMLWAKNKTSKAAQSTTEPKEQMDRLFFSHGKIRFS